MQRLSERQRGILNEQISEDEIKKAISNTKIGKSPGPDGYTARFYRAFKEDLTKPLQKLFNKIFKVVLLLRCGNKQ